MTFLRNCWYVAGHAQDATRTPFAKTYLGEPVMIYRKASGELVALSDRCAHRFAPLHTGKLHGDVIECAYHGLRFNPDGSCAHVPLSGGTKIPAGAKLKSYPIVERYGMLWIWMGEPALADPAKIPDFAYLEDPAYDWFPGTLYAKANYLLFVDNLLDLSHAEFLHAPEIASAGWAEKVKQTFERKDDSITVYNISEDDECLKLFQRMKPELPDFGTLTHLERWSAPSLICLKVTFEGNGLSACAPSGHFLTPETQFTTHYFFRGGQGFHPGNAEITAGMQAGITAVFREQDVPVIEAQQRYLGETDDILALHPALLNGDRAAVMARRSLAEMIRNEEQAKRAAEAPTMAAAV